MMQRSTTRIFLIALLLAATGAGCARLRLPAIDPSGQRIFLPAPNYTTLAGVEERDSCLPKPAFQAPPKPPACPPAGVVEQPTPDYIAVPILSLIHI